MKKEIPINGIALTIYQNDLQEMQNIAEVLGHLIIAEEHIHNNNSKLAIAHISHALHELKNKQYAGKIPQEYLEHLELLLHIIKSSTNKSLDNFDENIHIVIDTIHEIRINSIEKVLINDQIFQIQTAIYLLELSKIEYSIGVRLGDNFENNVEIQDAYGFTKQAQNILNNSIGPKFTVNLDEQLKIIQDVKSFKEFEDSLTNTLNNLYSLVN